MASEYALPRNHPQLKRNSIYRFFHPLKYSFTYSLIYSFIHSSSRLAIHPFNSHLMYPSSFACILSNVLSPCGNHPVHSIITHSTTPPAEHHRFIFIYLFVFMSIYIYIYVYLGEGIGGHGWSLTYSYVISLHGFGVNLRNN